MCPLCSCWLSEPHDERQRRVSPPRLTIVPALGSVFGGKVSIAQGGSDPFCSIAWTEAPQASMAKELMTGVATRVVEVLDDIFGLVPAENTSPCLKALVSLAGLAILQEPTPSGFEEPLKVHVRRSARNQIIRVLGKQEQTLEEAILAIGNAAKCARESVSLDTQVAAALPTAIGLAQVASATRYSVLAGALEQVFYGYEAPGYSAGVQVLEDAMLGLHAELRAYGMVKRVAAIGETGAGDRGVAAM